MAGPWTVAADSSILLASVGLSPATGDSPGSEALSALSSGNSWSVLDEPASVEAPPPRALWIFVAAVVATGSYFAHTTWQTQRGEAALKATALEFLPLEQALALAKSQGKPVLVAFSAIWCPTCRVLHAEVFTNAEVKQAITADYVLSRVDYESPGAQAFMQRYGVQGFPSLLVLSADGMLVRRVPVSFDPATLAATLRG